MKYDAFISYRHTPLDMEMAKKLHKGLETYHIPKAVQKKTGRKNIKRVFRDQEELPIGSDLDENISLALKESGYLIVVCSPNTPKSEWVCKEIDSFIQMHDRAHVLAMLIEGEPNESFPQQLLVDENGTPVEPLAADVRGTDPKERNKKFKTELLRLVAAILEVNYDDLRQRHRERRIRKIASIVSGIAAVVAVAGIAFGLYSSSMAAKMKKLADEKAVLADEKTVLADEKTKLAEDILAEYKEKQANQSRFYAKNSQALLENGNRRAAVLVAAQGLPSENNDRPYVPEAEYALSEALHAYDVGHDMGYDRTLEHDFNVITMALNIDRTRLVTVDSGENITVWNTGDWNKLATIESRIGDNEYVLHVTGAYADENRIYVSYEDSFYIYDYEGEVLSSTKDLDYIRGLYVIEDEELAYVISGSECYVVDVKNGRIVDSLENDSEEDAFSGRYAYEKTNGVLAIGHYNDTAQHATVSFFDDSNTKATLSQGYILDMCATPLGNIAVLTCNSDLLMEGINDVRIDLVNTQGKVLWSDRLEVNVWNTMSFNGIVKAHSYDKDGTQRNDIVAVCDRKGYTYDEATGKRIADIPLSGEAMTLDLSKDSGMGYVCYASGNLAPVEFDEGQVYTDFDIKVDVNIREVMFMPGKAAVSALRSTDVYVVSYHEAPDLVKTSETESVVFEAVADDFDCYVVESVDDIFAFYFMDSEGNLLYTFNSESTVKGIEFIGNICLFADKEKLWFIDPVNAKSEGVTYESMGMSFSPYYMDVTKNDKYAAFWSGGNVSIIDLANRKCIYEDDLDDFTGNAVASSDGSKLYVSPKGKALVEIDTASKEAKPFSDEYAGLANYSSNKYIELSADDRYITMCCKDGNVRIADTSDLSTKAVIPLQTKNNTFLKFAGDDRYLVVQGDDHKIRIWDMEKSTFIVSTDCYGNMDYAVSDNEDGLLAVGDGSQVYLFETGSYGLVAYVPYCTTYVKCNNRFVLKSRSELFYTVYKDYATLLQEVKIQFPNTALTEDEKVKYNID